MIFAKLVAGTLAVGVANSPIIESPHARVDQLSLQQINVVMRPYLDSATKCIARAVADAQGVPENGTSANLGDLIVASIPTCIKPVRKMIDAYDRNFGEGAGEALFMGPYLDALPRAVVNINGREGEPTGKR